MRSTNVCTPILINGTTCKTVVTAYVTAHINKSISSILALISVAIRRVDKTRCVINTFMSTLNIAISCSTYNQNEMHDIYKNNNFFIYTLVLIVQSILYNLLYIIRNI